MLTKALDTLASPAGSGSGGGCFKEADHILSPAVETL